MFLQHEKYKCNNFNTEWLNNKILPSDLCHKQS